MLFRFLTLILALFLISQPVLACEHDPDGLVCEVCQLENLSQILDRPMDDQDSFYLPDLPLPQVPEADATPVEVPLVFLTHEELVRAALSLPVFANHPLIRAYPVFVPVKPNPVKPVGWMEIEPKKYECCYCHLPYNVRGFLRRHEETCRRKPKPN